MHIRREGPRDLPAVRDLHRAAFGRPLEADLLDALRVDAGWLPRLSLVAVAGGDLVGHVCCTRGRVGERPALGLGPVAISPGCQGRGWGSALVHAVVAAAEALDEGLVCLLGDPAFYGRLGFVDARTVDVAAPDPGWGASFQARRLEGFEAHVGPFAYAAPFAEL